MWRTSPKVILFGEYDSGSRSAVAILLLDAGMGPHEQVLLKKCNRPAPAPVVPVARLKREGIQKGGFRDDASGNDNVSRFRFP
jgi:hypothetical protein